MKQFIPIVLILLSFAVIWDPKISYVTWPAQNDGYADRYDFKNKTEKQQFRSLLKKHGLLHKISVVYDYPEAPYYYNREGKKCRFK